MKITLILAAPPTDALIGGEPFMPLSLPLLAGAAPDHDYRFIDMLREKRPIDANADVDLVGISVRMTAEATAYEVAGAFRKKGVPVVLGGPQVSAVPHRAARHADAVVIGEGEPLWPRVLADFENGSLKKFYVCSPEPFDGKGEPVHRIDAFPDLKNVPAPRRDLFGRRYRFDTVFASRGCPIGCDFCAVPGLYGKKLRLRPIEDVVREIETFKGFYYLIDDTVFGRPGAYGYYLELFDAIAKLKKKRYFTGQANLDAASSGKGRAVIKKAAEAGLIYAMVGMESINPAVLEKSGAIRKSGGRDGDPVARMREQIAFLQEQGILVSGWFTIGYEDDDLETYARTEAFCRETNILPVLSPLSALPGTELYRRLQAEGRLDWDGGATNVVHPALTRDTVVAELDRIVNGSYAFSEVMRRTRFHQNAAKRAPHVERKDRIHQYIFSLILQTNMGRILKRENDNLRHGRALGIPAKAGERDAAASRSRTFPKNCGADKPSG